MKAQHLVAVAFSAVVGAGAIEAQAREVDPRGTIEVACAGDSVRMAAITHAVANNHYWAPQAARRKMVSLARQACAGGAESVTFVPPADLRSCLTPPTWSTLCVERTPAVRRTGDASIVSSPSPRE
jgi:hypothetical protein